eukprot:221855_1
MSVAIFLSELLKFVACLTMATVNIKSKGMSVMEHYQILAERSLPMVIPALIYFVQNTISFHVLTYLPANIYTSMTQLKTMTTALFSVLILGTVLSPRKWRAITLLVIGALLVEAGMRPLDLITAGNSVKSPVTNLMDIDKLRQPSLQGDLDSFSEATMGVEDHMTKAEDFGFGIFLTLIQVSLSGFAGIYFEKVLKSRSTEGRQLNVWDRNIQLAFFSLIFALASLQTDVALIAEKGIFYDFSVRVWMVVFFMAAGGILVALTVAYTSTIVKAFAASGAIVLTSICDYLLFDAILTRVFICGAACVILSIFNYAEQDSPPLSLTPKANPSRASPNWTSPLSDRECEKLIHTA